MDIINFIIEVEEKGIKLRLKNNKLIVYKSTKIDKVTLERLKFNKEAIINTLKNDELIKLAGLKACEKKGVYKLSSAEKRMFLAQHSHPQSTAFNTPFVLKLHVVIDSLNLKDALLKLINRHEILSCSYQFQSGGPVKIKNQISDIFVKEYSTKRNNLNRVIRDFIKSFDLEKPPLFRVALLHCENDNYLLLDFNHIIIDAISIQIFLVELNALYLNQDLIFPHFQYEDYTEWNKLYSKSVDFMKQKRFWLNEYQETSNKLNLPIDGNLNPEDNKLAGGLINFNLGKSISKEIRSYSEENKLMIFPFLLSSFAVFMFKLTGQTSFTIGTPILNRQKTYLNNVIGNFQNILPVKFIMYKEMSVSLYMKQAQNKIITCLNNGNYPFEELIESLDINKETSSTPLFNVLFSHQYRKQEISSSKTIFNLSSLQDLSPDTSQYKLSFNCIESESDFQFMIEYSTDNFYKSTINKYIEYYKNVINCIVNSSIKELHSIELLSSHEKEILINRYNNTSKPFSKNKCIHTLFEEQVDKSSKNNAIFFKDEIITYDVLNKSCNQLAHCLISLSVKVGDKIAVFLERSPNILQALLAISKSGGCYIPIDSNWPKERVHTILKMHDIKFIITQSKYVNLISERLFTADGSKKIILLDVDTEKPISEPIFENETKDLWDNIIETSKGIITAGGFISSYTGLPFSGHEVCEYQSRIKLLLEPYTNFNKINVLDIGCGSGSSLICIADNVFSVTGVDPSVKSLEWCKKEANRKNIQNIKILQSFAHEIDELTNEKYDIIMLSSTIQFFPGIFYLSDVIQKCYNLLTEDGILLISDILDIRMKDDFQKSLIEFKNRHSSENFKTRLNLDEELYLDENYFKQVLVGNDINCKISHRESGFDNELKYRFDVIFEKGVKSQMTSSPSVNFYTNWHINNMPTENLNLKYSPNNLAYIISTSGSTGMPNGVAVSHKPVINLIEWVNNSFNISSNDKLLFTTSICFDLSVYDIFGMLASGGAIRIATEEELKQPEKLVDYLCNDGITFWDSAPAAMQQLVDYFPTRETANYSKLRLVFLSGDWIPVSLPNQIRNTFEEAGVISLGGATEATVWSNYYPIGKVEKNWPSIPYGKPIQNAKYYILDTELRVCPFNVSGDLYIGGECLAQGYANNEKLTKERFITNPFSDAPNEKIYKTGDIAKWLPDGNMIFLGRKDSQVKIRGYRIELGDIESKIAVYPGIIWCKVLTKHDNSNDKVLCAFYKSEHHIDGHIIKESLESQLPSYMVPQIVQQIEDIPKTVNGKVDHKKLINDLELTSKEIIKPESELEINLRGIWVRVLDIEEDKISMNDSFFSLGGHSLKIMKLSHLIYKEFEIEIKQSLIFSNPVLGDLANVIDKEMKKQEVSVDNIDEIII